MLKSPLPGGVMFLRSFEKLPPELQNDSVRKYYDILAKKRASIIFKRLTDIFFKRLTDILLALIMLIILILPMAIIALVVKTTSKGPVFYRQERVTTYNRRFMILKFRTMTVGADKAGALVTSANDARVTKVGAKLRKFRLDELPQIFHVLSGKMSFVGTRPEVVRFVERYEPEMMATLLMPAGITSLASIRYKDEDEIIGSISDLNDVDRVYIEQILPEKMKYNLEYLSDFSFFGDIKLMLSTVKNVF